MTAKDNFLLKISQREVFNELSDEEAGKLIKGIFNYVCDGNSGLTGLLNVVFIPIKKDIDKNEENYQKKCEKNKESVKKRWEKEREKDTNVYERIPNDTETYEDIPNDTDTRHISYITNHNSLEKDNRVIGEEEKTTPPPTNNKPNDGGLLQESEEIINYLNEVVGTQYRPNSKESQKHIKARLNEGYSIDDFKQVIDNMAFKWLNDEKMNRYLRPETLFGTKFESYLNELPKVKIPKTLKDVSMEDIDKMIEIERSRKNDPNRVFKRDENDNNVL